VKDADGDVAPAGNLVITIIDDVPTAVADQDSVNGGASAVGNVLTGIGTTAGASSADTAGADGYAVGGGVVGVRAAGSDLTSAVTTGVTASITGTRGTLVLQADGSYNYIANGAATTGSDVFVYSIKDGDGDISTTTLTFNVTASVPPSGTGAAITLDEEALGLTAAMGTNPSSNAETGISVVTFTAGSGTLTGFQFTTVAGLTADINGIAGTDIVWTLVNSTQITGTVNGLLAVTLNLINSNLTSGTVEVQATLSDNLPHPNGGGEQNISIGSVSVQATNSNGLTGVATVAINMIDDVPLAFVPDAAVLLNQVGATTTVPLDNDSNINPNLGADGGIVRFPTSLNGVNSGLTSGGLTITYTVSADGQTVTGSTVLGTVFTVVLNNGAGATDTYSVNLLGTVDGSSSQVVFGGTRYTFTGGNDPWFGMLDNSAADQDLLVTPIIANAPNGTINTTSSGPSGTAGVDSGASIGPSEAIRVDFVKSLAGNPTKNSSSEDYGDLTSRDHTFASHNTVNGTTATFSGIAGGTPKSRILIKAFDDFDSDYVVGDGGQDSINAVVLSLGASTNYISVTNGLIQTVTVGTASVTVTFVDIDPSPLTTKYQALVDGVVNNMIVGVYTADGYSSVEYHYDGLQEFKIGGYGTSSIVQGVPVEFAIPVQLIDGDGDISVAELNVALAPSGGTFVTGNGTDVLTTLAANTHLSGSEGADRYDGTSGNDVMYGNGGVDTLSGLAGNDILLGGVDDDFLTGGEGSDILIGGTGFDTITLTETTQVRDTVMIDVDALGSNTVDDLIIGYNSDAATGDVIDLSDIFDTFPAGPTSAADVNNFITLTPVGANTSLTVDSNGAAAGGTISQVATLSGNITTVNILWEDDQPIATGAA
jgi:RTX calcium-binding nonapeptide repeat (4 copies)